MSCAVNHSLCVYLLYGSKQHEYESYFRLRKYLEYLSPLITPLIMIDEMPAGGKYIGTIFRDSAFRQLLNKFRKIMSTDLRQMGNILKLNLICALELRTNVSVF